MVLLALFLAHSHWAIASDFELVHFIQSSNTKCAGQQKSQVKKFKVKAESYINMRWIYMKESEPKHICIITILEIYPVVCFSSYLRLFLCHPSSLPIPHLCIKFDLSFQYIIHLIYWRWSRTRIHTHTHTHRRAHTRIHTASLQSSCKRIGLSWPLRVIPSLTI